MSKTYRVRLGTVTEESADRRRVVCPRIVPEMPEILGAALKSRGWSVDGATKKATKRVGAVTATVDLDEPVMELKAAASEDVIGQAWEANDDDAKGEVAARADGERQRGRARARAKERAQAAVAAGEAAVRDEVLAAVKAALVEALTRKAAELGRVESVVQGTDAQGRAVTTIKVEV